MLLGWSSVYVYSLTTCPKPCVQPALFKLTPDSRGPLSTPYSPAPTPIHAYIAAMSYTGSGIQVRGLNPPLLSCMILKSTFFSLYYWKVPFVLSWLLESPFTWCKVKLIMVPTTIWLLSEWQYDFWKGSQTVIWSFGINDKLIIN